MKAQPTIAITMHSNTNIQTLKQLQTAIQTTKKQVQISEAALYNCWQKLPTEIAKTTISSLIPAIINQSIANKLYHTAIKSIFQLFINSSNSAIKQTIISAIKHVGIATLLKAIIKVFVKP